MSELAPTKYAGKATWVVAPVAFEVAVGVVLGVGVPAGVTCGLPVLATPQAMAPMRATDAAAATGMSQRRRGSVSSLCSWTMARISVRRSRGVIRSA